MTDGILTAALIALALAGAITLDRWLAKGWSEFITGLRADISARERLHEDLRGQWLIVEIGALRARKKRFSHLANELAAIRARQLGRM